MRGTPSRCNLWFDSQSRRSHGLHSILGCSREAERTVSRHTDRNETWRPPQRCSTVPFQNQSTLTAFAGATCACASTAAVRSRFSMLQRVISPHMKNSSVAGAVVLLDNTQLRCWTCESRRTFREIRESRWPAILSGAREALCASSTVVYG